MEQLVALGLVLTHVCVETSKGLGLGEKGNGEPSLARTTLFYSLSYYSGMGERDI